MAACSGRERFCAVVAQGVLGGLRVTQLKAQLGIFHATLAQLFFVLVSAIALFQTDFWRGCLSGPKTDRRRLRFLFIAATGLVLGQFVLGATMRHQHAGLAIPDFPAAYGKFWPDASPAAILELQSKPLGSLWRQPHHRLPDRPANGPPPAGPGSFLLR